MAGQGKGAGNNVVYQAVPITTVEKRLLQASPNPFTLHTQRKASNPFTQYQPVSYTHLDVYKRQR